MTFNIGDRVYFGRTNGEKSLGEVVKVNRKSLKVKLLEERGARRNYAVGGTWRVPPSLCTLADEDRPADRPAALIGIFRTVQKYRPDIIYIHPCIRIGSA